MHTVHGQPLPGSGDDRIFGRAGADTLYGLDGNDKILGGTGNDQLFGGLGKDVLRGNPGDDQLFGGPGNDRLNGGTGHNRLNGGGGADRYVFATLDTFATIANFTHGVDKFELWKNIFKSIHHVSYVAATGGVYFDADGPGGAAPIQFAALAPHLHIGAGDFLFV